MKNIWVEYEEQKKEIISRNLTPEKYEKEIKYLIKNLETITLDEAEKRWR